MPDRKTKSISHRRAEWIVTPAPTLESCIKAALQKAPTVAKRTITSGDGRELKCAAFDVAPRNGGVLLHLTVETPGEQASVVPKPDGSSTETAVGVVDAPNNTEFMDGDAFIYVKTDELCMCSTYCGEGTIKLFLYEFFKSTGIRQDSVKFDLFKTIDMEKLSMLQNGKVKEIRIKASAYKASASYSQRQHSSFGVMGVISKYIRAFTGSEHDVTNDSMRVELTLKTDKRSTQHLNVGERRIEEIAQDIITNEQPGDEYTIELEDGGTISPKELFVKSDVQIEGHG